MSKLEIQSVKPGVGQYMFEKPFSEQDFLALTAEDLIIQHHRHNGNFSYFYLKNNQDKDMCFLLSQDNDLIKELKMLPLTPKNDPTRSFDLFDDHQQQLSSISVSQLLDNLDLTQSSTQFDTQLAVDGRHYSFRLAVGKKANNLIKTIEQYAEELENIQDYKEVSTDSTPKLK